MASFWQSVKNAFTRFTQILTSKDGEEGVLNMLSGKTAAIAVGVFGFVLLMLPVNSIQIMSIGDSLLRTSVVMWNGG